MSAVVLRLPQGLLFACALLGCLALGACDTRQSAPPSPAAGGAAIAEAGSGQGAGVAAAPDCGSLVAAGCACESGRTATCDPGGEPERNADGQVVCQEGTRHCRQGRWSVCEDIQRFVPAGSLAPSALVDQGAVHEQCSECERNCFIVIDELDPNDSTPAGTLEAAFGTGVAYDPGGGLTLTETPGAVPPVPPATGFAEYPDLVYIPVPVGSTAVGSYQALHHPPAADIYFLFDASLNAEVTDELLALQRVGNGYLPGTALPAATCQSGDPVAMAAGGLWGSLHCMIADPATGVGFFRDIPFTPYAGAPADPLAEIAFQSEQAIDVDGALTLAAFSNVLGEMEEAGDRAGGHVPALHSIATGAGIDAGLGRHLVPPAAACAGADFGYPCFRDGGDPIVLMITPNPGHNVSDDAAVDPAGAYDYDPAQLDMMSGTSGVTQVPIVPANDDTASAYDLTAGAPPEDNLATMLTVFEGSTTHLTPAVSAVAAGAAAGCAPDDAAADAVFEFYVDASGEIDGTAEISFSAAGTAFQSSLSIHDAPPSGGSSVSPPTTNEHFGGGSVYDLGDIGTSAVVAAGDTTAMASDYQRSLLTYACSSNSESPDSAFSFHVTGSDTDVTVDLDMGAERSALAIYAASDLPPRWPAAGAAVTAVDNSSPVDGGAHPLPFGAGNEYVAVRGDTDAVSDDYSSAGLYSGACTADDVGADSVFRLDITERRRVRIDTEGSSFDTVLSLHGSPPPLKAGNVLVHAAADTHMNLNEAPDDNPYDAGSVNGLTQTWQGDTTGMRADDLAPGSCGLGNCPDAVYRIHVDERSTFEIDVTDPGSTWQPGLSITRAPPDGVQPSYPAIAAGAEHTCAMSGDQVYCWGSDASGQLGDGDPATGNVAAAQAVSLPGGLPVQVAAGQAHSCATAGNGLAFCWGDNSAGQLGDGTTSQRNSPAAVSGLTDVVQVAAGDDHSCALRTGGEVVCWGDNGGGQLGDGGGDSTTPVAVAGGGVYKQVATNGAQSCALRNGDGAVFCWGTGATTSATPVRVGSLSGAADLMVGPAHSCGVLSNGEVWCWGANALGQLGDGTTTARAAPVAVLDIDGTVLRSAAAGWAAGSAHSCVTTHVGFVVCWGDNSVGQLGNGSIGGSVPVPAPAVDFLTARQVASSENHSCVLNDDGTAHCFGQGTHAELGDGGGANQGTRVPMQPDNVAAPTGVNFGDGGLNRAQTLACKAGSREPEAGCEQVIRNGQTYYFCKNANRDWADAGLACEAAGTQLAVPDDDAELSFIASELSGTGQRAWLGMRRVATGDDWLELPHFETVDSTRVWTSTDAHRCTFWLITCLSSQVDIDGYFEAPWSGGGLSQSDWQGGASDPNPEPNPAWGHNCVSVDENGKLRAEPCTDVPEPPPNDDGSGLCGLPVVRILCLVVGAVFGILDAVTLSLIPWLDDPLNLNGSLGGQYTSPLYNGGVTAPYVCEAPAGATQTVTLDPGDYWVTVKGTDGGGSCEGDYELTIADQGAPGDGMIACNDDGDPDAFGPSVIEETLDPGTYYVVVKAWDEVDRAASDGEYNVTVRDVDAVLPVAPVLDTGAALACDTDGGSGASSSVTFNAQVGETYYAVVKGDRPGDAGAYSLEAGPATSNTLIACDDTSGAGGTPELSAALGTEVSLATGTYYAVLKGRNGEDGDYRLTVGGATPTISTFVPPSYDATVDALRDDTVHPRIRVSTVLWCDDGAQGCSDASDHWTHLSDATGGGLRVAANADAVPAEIVAAVQTLERLDSLTATLMPPATPPGFQNVTVSAVLDPANGCVSEAGAVASTCRPGATPSFEVSVSHPAGAPVLPAVGNQGAYRYLMTLEGVRDGVVVATQTVPVYIFPADSAPAGTYSTGGYHQSFDSRGCDDGQSADLGVFRPSWDRLAFEAAVLPDTSMDFMVCSADSMADLDGCESAASTVSGYFRALTVTAGTGSGTPCTMDSECPGGFCSPYLGICQYLEGASCTVDEDCPDFVAGSCHDGPSVATLMKTCRVTDQTAVPSSALSEGNYRPYLRLKAEMQSGGDQSRTPSLYQWSVQYHCEQPE